MISNGKKSSARFLIRISVSVLALEEYNTLQQRYALETQCRVEAEKYAAEVGNLSDGVGVGVGGGGTNDSFCWVCVDGLSEPLFHYNLFFDQLWTSP